MNGDGRWHRAAFGLAAAAVLLTAGCAGTTTGTARTAPSPSSTATSTTPTLASTASIKGKLLSLPRLEQIVGDTDMKQLASYTQPDWQTSGVEPFDCRSVMLAAVASSYMTEKRQGLLGDVDRGAGGNVAAQVVSVFTTRAATAEFLQLVGYDWDACVAKGGLTLTGDEPQQWTVSPMERSDGRSAITATRRTGKPRTCRHVFASQANVIVEAAACGDGDTVGQADQIVKELLAKFPS